MSKADEKFIYGVAKNGLINPKKLKVVKETKRTYLLLDGSFQITVRKATMERGYERFFEKEEDAEKFYNSFHETHKSSVEPMKTADEMFRKCGYVLAESESAYPLYVNSGGEKIEACPYEYGVAKYEIMYGYGVRHLPFSTEEILACAQLIKEMEEEE